MSRFISKTSIESIRDAADIVSIIGEYTKLERRGGNDWWGCCPFHNEKSASFHVDGDKKFYYCFGCHASGDIIKFITEIEKINYSDAIEMLSKKTNIPLTYENNQQPENFIQDNKVDKYIELYERISTMFHYFLLETEQGKSALDYITKRGLSLETIKKFKLGYAPKDRYWLKRFLRSKNFSDDFLKDSGLFSKNYPDISFFSDRLMFPIFNRRGQIVAFGGRILHPQNENDRKYLNSSDLPQFKKKDTLYAFNFAKNAIRDTKSAIFCEGYMDCIAYHQCGIENAVAPLGTALTEDHIKMVKGFADTVYLSFDSDNAGQQATKRAILLCRQNNLTVKVIRLTGGKDPAEIMLNYGKNNLTMQVKNAILDTDYLLNILGEKYLNNTPEGKTKVALEFFTYIDSLQFDIQKESCLDILSQTLNLKPEAVKKDFLNRQQAKERVNLRQNNKTEVIEKINLNAELRGLLAITADLEQYKILRSNLKKDDFKNPTAKKLYSVLDECCNENLYTLQNILEKCDEGLNNLIADTLSSNVYNKDNISIIVSDTIKMVKKNNLEEKRDKLLQRIKEYKVVTDEDKNQLQSLLSDKMELDKQVQLLQK